MSQPHTKAGTRRCGEKDGKFYDRIGDYFRPGVDPRNYHGRFVPELLDGGGKWASIDGPFGDMFHSNGKELFG